MALRFAAEGADVVIGDVCRDPREGGRPTNELITESGGSGTFVEADVSRAADIDRLVRTAVDRRGRLDVMVNNAIVAGRHSKGLLETEEGDWDAIMAVGLRGVFLCCRRAVQQMLTQEPVGDARGRIINLSSQHGMVGAPGHVAYCAAKGGMITMTKAMALDHGPQGVRVNAVCPGDTDTPMERADAQSKGWSWDEYVRWASEGRPIPRMGSPEEVAKAVLFLAGDESSFITGAALPVDGGGVAG
jgi:NAD(P)-dependent dehydrogenase (short-subunit alcohol dehydrogenase family)